MDRLCEMNNNEMKIMFSPEPDVEDEDASQPSSELFLLFAGAFFVGDTITVLDGEEEVEPLSVSLMSFKIISRSFCSTSCHPSRSVGSSMIFVVARAFLKISNMHLG